MSEDQTTVWLKSGKYLPEFLRDFHDQKDVFKAIHELLNVEQNDYTNKVSWVAAQVYTIDIFLWFMARRGYTLQRTRRKGTYKDLHSDIENQKKQRYEAFGEMIRPKQVTE